MLMLIAMNHSTMRIVKSSPSAAQLVASAIRKATANTASTG